MPAGPISHASDYDHVVPCVPVSKTDSSLSSFSPNCDFDFAAEFGGWKRWFIFNRVHDYFNRKMPAKFVGSA